MRHLAAISLTTLAVLGLGHTPAMAMWDPNAAPGQQFPNEQPINDPFVTALRDAAVKFWTDRNVTVPTTARIDTADNLAIDGDPLDPWARTSGPAQGDTTGHIIFNGQQLSSILTDARNTKLSVRDRRQRLSWLAPILFHEYGHAAGLDHNSGGMMAPDVTSVPWDAQRAINRLIPREPTRQRRTTHGGGIIG